MNTDTLGYRFKKIPSFFGAFETYSFGIEPFTIKNGRQVKAGKAVVRIVMYRMVDLVRADAELVAQRIADNLSVGKTYTGPKVLHLDKASKYTAGKIDGYFENRLTGEGVQ